MKCYQAKAGELAKHWYVIDAEGMVVGRLAAQIAPILMGKHRPTYTPHIDTGDYVIVTNVDKVVFTGNKWRQKSYQRYAGYPGGQKEEAAWKLFQRRPERILRAGDPADDAEEQDRPAHDGEAEALRRAQSSAPGAAARSRSSRSRAGRRPPGRSSSRARPKDAAGSPRRATGRPTTARRSPARPTRPGRAVAASPPAEPPIRAEAQHAAGRRHGSRDGRGAEPEPRRDVPS